MNETGRIADVVIEDVYFFKGDPDKEKVAGYVMVWADAGMKDVIAGVEGVEACYKDLGETRYHAYLDVRYNREIVKKNIKLAVVQVGKPAPEPAPELDAEKVRALIGVITFEAYKWGYRRACLFNEQYSEAVREVFLRDGNNAMDKCTDARTELKKLLGIEEG